MQDRQHLVPIMYGLTGIGMPAVDAIIGEKAIGEEQVAGFG